MTNSNAAPFKPLVATAGYYASYIILGATMALLGPSLPWLAENTASRRDQISLIFAASAFGYMTASLLGGRIYDRLPGHRIQAPALLLISVGAAIVPVIPTLWVLVGIVFILGNLQGCGAVETVSKPPRLIHGFDRSPPNPTRFRSTFAPPPRRGPL